VRIAVHDTGLGIPQSKQRAIFMEFHRLDHGARVARGLGLGLSIVERIGRVLDHPIALRSEVGRGSMFAVDVPLAVAPSPAQPVPSPARAEPGQLAGATLLCVDNDPAILDGMEALLRGWGCNCLKAPDRASALAAVVESRVVPNGLLVDYHLDEGNGIEVIAALRSLCGSDLPAILITADRSPLVRDAARAHNVQVLHKPLKPAALRALLAQHRVQRAAAAE
jgi:CheY-like chemotaxis protein